MAKIQLPSFPAAANANLSDLLLARQGSVDKKLTVQLLKNLLLNNNDFTAADILSLLLTVDGTGSGLDADLLDGQQSTFYRDASNLNAGTIPSGRLNASDLLTLIKTVDGSGSGLDADSLDGQSSSFYRNASNLNAGTVSQSRLPSSTTSQEGIIEQATQSQVNAGSSGNLAVIASTLRNEVLYSLGSTGYIKFPSWLGGFTIQWGNLNVSGNSTGADTFPRTFTSARQVFCSFGSDPGNDAQPCAVVNFSNGGVTFRNADGGTRRINWIAIGTS